MLLYPFSFFRQDNVYKGFGCVLFK